MADPTPAKALLLALTRCDRLSPERQQHLHEIGLALANPQSNGQVNDQIRDFVHQDERLKVYYTEAYDYLQADYQTQERSKNFDVAHSLNWDFSLDHLIQTFSAPDSVMAACQVLQRVKQPVSGGIWEKFDRLAIMGAGGAFLGGAIVQLLGGGSVQILGALLGAIMGILGGWYVTPSSSPSRRNSQN